MGGVAAYLSRKYKRANNAEASHNLLDIAETSAGYLQYLARE